MRDQNDRILYIGKAKALRNRVRSYFQNSQNHSPRISLMVRQICEIEFIRPTARQKPSPWNRI